MEAVKTDGRTHTIEIPAKWWPADDDLFMNKVGSTIIIMPKSKVKEAMRDAAYAFTPDLFEEA